MVVQRSESQDVSVGRRVALPAALLTLAAVACVLAGGGSHKGMVSLNQLGVRSPLPTIPQATYPFQRGGAQPTPASARSLTPKLLEPGFRGVGLRRSDSHRGLSRGRRRGPLARQRSQRRRTTLPTSRPRTLPQRAAGRLLTHRSARRTTPLSETPLGWVAKHVRGGPDRLSQTVACLRQARAFQTSDSAEVDPRGKLRGAGHPKP